MLRPCRSLFACALVLGMMGSLSAQENNQPPEGFTAIFNGKDFDDWTGGTTRDPREITNHLSAEERAAWDKRMKEGIERHWSVEDGILISDGEEPYLATKEEYGDFEMWCDWSIDAGGDSGIYLRGVPQVQIWDPTNEAAHRHGADKGSGGLWNNEKHERFPTELADKPIGEWNRMYIRMVGPYVTVKLNGKTVVDNVIMENYYDRSIPVFARGPIYLQTHGAETRFRNIFVREMPAEEANRLLAEIDGEEGFTSLFNGKDLTGWIGATGDYEVTDGAIQCKPGRGGNLFAEDEYDNFIVRLEFKLPPGGNNGLAIRAVSPDKNPAYDGMELQVLDDTAEMYRDLEDYQYHGSLYGLAPATRGYLRPVGEWNYQEVEVDGDKLIVRLNGFEILNVDLAEVRNQPRDGSPHPGAARKAGYFGFAGHNDPVSFRNIRIKRLGTE